MTQPKVRCPFCGGYASKVTDSRPSESGIYRRRECLACFKRYSTEELYRRYAKGRIKKQSHHKM